MFGIFLGNVILYAIVGFLLLKANPFGLAAAARRYSQDLPNQILAPLYRTTGQEQITVLLIVDRVLEEEKEPWPVRYGFHARVLKLLLLHRPRRSSRQTQIPWNGRSRDH